jgi:predicted RNA polymerase sigma factor
LRANNLRVLTKRTDKRDFSVELVLAGDVHAPLSANARVGDIIVKVREAADAYDRAIRLAKDDAVKRLLLNQRG